MSTDDPRSEEPSAAASSRRRYLIWLAVYLVMLVLVVVGMVQFRRVALETMDTPEAQAQWQQWRESAPNQQQDDLPVKRRAPKSPEPPLLVLMRDHFTVVMSGAILFSSLLFVALAFAARGAFGSETLARGSYPDARRADAGNGDPG